MDKTETGNITIKCPVCDEFLYKTTFTEKELECTERNADEFTPIGNQERGEDGERIPPCNVCGSNWIEVFKGDVKISTTAGILVFGKV